MRRKRIYTSGGTDRNSPSHLAKRLMNGIDSKNKGECWLWQRATNGIGYGTLTINGRRQYAHRLAYTLYIGPIPCGMCVCHHCDNPGCINPDHLFAGTRSDNMRDCANKGRHRPPIVSFPGESNPSAKLKETDIIEIRKLLSSGMTQRLIANKYHISQAIISLINNNLAWSHVGRAARKDGES